MSTWDTVPIGSFSTVIAGQSPEGQYYNDQRKGLPFYQGKKEFGDKYVGAPQTWTTKVTKEALAGDILISVRAPVGPINFATERICIGRGLAAIRTKKDVDKEFLFYALLWKQDEIKGKEGAVFASINKEQIEAIPIPLPPLDEQKRIVAILDEAFAGIDKAIANTQKSLSNVRELFQATFDSWTASLSSDIQFVNLASLARQEKGAIRTGPFGSQLLHSEFVGNGIAVLGIDNAVTNEFQWRERRYITPAKFQQLKRFQVKPRDVVITIMGTCGRCAIVPDDIPIAINTKHLCCITLDQEKCLPEYLHGYFLHHPTAQQYLKKRAKGSIMAGLNMGIIQEMPVLLPQIEVQQRIVLNLTSLTKFTKQLTVAYQEKIMSMQELKQSILQKAFTGELTAKPERVLAGVGA